MPTSGGIKPKIVESHLAPAQERIALDVALEFDFRIFLERIGGAEIIDLHRVVDHQIDRCQRIDLLGIAAQPLHRLAHGRQIDHGGNTGQVLHQHPRRHEGDFFSRFYLGIPVGQRFNVGFVDVMIVFLPEQILQQDLQRYRQARDILKSRLLQQIEAKNIVALAVDGQDLTRAETVHILLCHERSLSKDW